MDDATDTELSCALKDAAATSGGRLDLTGFKRVIASVRGCESIPVEHLFSLFDTDGSGDVDLRELRTTLACLRTSNRMRSTAPSTGAGAEGGSAPVDFRQALRLVFDIYDTDGSGCLTPDELMSLLMAVGIDMLTR